MSEYLSWGDVAANSLNVLLNVVVALSLATGLVTAFALFGRRYSLDPRVFPTVSANQRQWFGLLGFYLLMLTAMEILNPPSLAFLTSDSIAFRPSFLDARFIGLTVQDLMSISALAALLVVFVLRVRQLNRSTSRVPRQVSERTSHLSVRAFRQQSAILRFAFGFVAVSLLIAIIAPGLANFGTESVGTIVILGLFLIGGVTSYLQAMQLGAIYSSQSRGYLIYLLFRHVFLTQWLLYIGIALAGYWIHSGLPGHFADEPSMGATLELTRSVSKIVAGVLVVMAAYLLCWGVDGFAARLQRFIVVATLVPAILPLMKLIAVITGRADSISMERGSGFALLYAIVLLIVPVLAYIFSSAEASQASASKARSIAYVRTMAWAPLAIGRTLSGEASVELRFVPFSTAEELLEEMVGRKARGAYVSLPGSVRLRHVLSRVLGWHRDFDAIVLDLRSTLRLFDALGAQGRLESGGYFIVAGISRRQDVVVQRYSDAVDTTKPHAIWSDAPYIPRNEALETLVTESLRRVQPQLDGVDYLPPNCILERLPQGAVAAIPEPFATDLMSRTATRGDTSRMRFDRLGDLTWIYEHYDVLVARQDAHGDFPTQFLDMLIAGRDWLRTKPGPAGLGGTFARHLTAELEGISVAELEADPDAFLDQAAVSSCLALTDFQAGSVIDPDDEREDSNWLAVRELFARMRTTELITSLTIDELAERIDCSYMQMNTDFIGQRAVYPLQVNRFLTNDTPGKLRDMLHALQSDNVNLSFLLAQRVTGAGGVGLVYMLPTHADDTRNLNQAASHHEWITAGKSGFLAVSISDDAWGLRHMLDVVHLDPELSIETIAAFPGPHGRAIALMSFGDIPETQLRRLIVSLKQHGFDITTEPSQWSSAPA